MERLCCLARDWLCTGMLALMITGVNHPHLFSSKRIIGYF